MLDIRSLFVGSLLCIFATTIQVNSQTPNSRLQKSIDLLNGNQTYKYTSKSKIQGHYSKPWETTDVESYGVFSFSVESQFIQQDKTKDRGGKTVISEKMIDGNGIGVFKHGNNKIAELDKIETQQELFDTLALSPLPMLNELVKQNSTYKFDRKHKNTFYFKTANKTQIEIFLNKKNLVKKIAISYYNEFYGDSRKIYKYSKYKKSGNSIYPTQIKMKEFGIEFVNTSIQTSDKSFAKTDLINKFPSSFAIARSQKPTYNIEYKKYNENIHLLYIEDADSYNLIVDFPSFLLVSGAPFNSKYGELMVKKTREIFPKKEIRYFTFGHHHPHYLGGVREFIHQEATILSHSSNKKYLNQLANFRHSIIPDNLEKYPKKLKTEFFEKKKIIKDGDIEMHLIHIGNQSKHTEDYTVYYFPKYKLLFEEDLVWIKLDGTKRPASPRQIGLYQAILDNNLDVKNILQSWAVNAYGIKTEIKFEELKETIKANYLIKK